MLLWHIIIYYIYIYACACYTCDWNFATWMDMLSKITMACFWEKYRSMGCPRIGYVYPAVYSCISCSSSSLISRQKYHVLNPFKSNHILYNIPRSYNIYIYYIIYICLNPIYTYVCVWNIPRSPEMGGINHPQPGSCFQAHFRRAVARRNLGESEEAREDLQAMAAMGNTWMDWPW